MKSKSKTVADAAGADAAAKKPVVKVIDIGDGDFRIVNATRAARWLGVSRQAFTRVVRARIQAMKRPHTIYNEVVEKVKAGYPELFSMDAAVVV